MVSYSVDRSTLNSVVCKIEWPKVGRDLKDGVISCEASKPRATRHVISVDPSTAKYSRVVEKHYLCLLYAQAHEKLKKKMIFST